MSKRSAGTGVGGNKKREAKHFEPKKPLKANSATTTNESNGNNTNAKYVERNDHSDKGAACTLKLEEVQELIKEISFVSFLETDSDSSSSTNEQLTKLWVLKACDHFFEIEKGKSLKNTRQRHNPWNKSNKLRGTYSSKHYSANSHQNEKWHHRDQIKHGMVPSFGARISVAHEDQNLDRFVGKLKKLASWESEKEFSRLHWPDIYDPISFERNVLPIKRIKGSSITFSFAQCKKLLYMANRKTSLQAHQKGRRPEEIVKEWDDLGGQIERSTIESLPNLHTKYQEMLSEFLNSLEQFSERPTWTSILQTVDEELKRLTESCKEYETALLESCKENSKFQENASSCIEKSADVFISALKDSLGTKINEAVKEEVSRIDKLVDSIWQATHEEFKNRTADAKIGNKNVIGPKASSKAKELLGSKLDTISSDIGSRVKKVQGEIAGNKEDLEHPESKLSKIIQICLPGSFADMIKGSLAQIAKLLDNYACSQLKSLGLAIQRLLDLYSRMLESELVNTKWYTLMTAAIDCRMEYSWNLRYGATLLMYGLAKVISSKQGAAISDAEPTVNGDLSITEDQHIASVSGKDKPEQASGKTRTSAKQAQAKQLGTKQIGKDKTVTKQQQSTGPTKGEKSTKQEGPGKQVSAGRQSAPAKSQVPKPSSSLPQTRQQHQRNPTANTHEQKSVTMPSLSYSQVTTQANTISSITQEYEKRLKELAESKDLEIKRLKEENEMYKSKMDSENDSIRVELESSVKQVEHLQKVLKDAEKEIEAQRHIQIQLSQVVKSLQRDARQTNVQPNPTPLGYYQQHTAPVMMMHPGTSQVVGYAGHPAYHMQAQHSQLYTADQANASFQGIGSSSSYQTDNSKKSDQNR